MEAALPSILPWLPNPFGGLIWMFGYLAIIFSWINATFFSNYAIDYILKNSSFFYFSIVSGSIWGYGVTGTSTVVGTDIVVGMTTTFYYFLSILFEWFLDASNRLVILTCRECWRLSYLIISAGADSWFYRIVCVCI